MCSNLLYAHEFVFFCSQRFSLIILLRTYLHMLLSLLKTERVCVILPIPNYFPQMREMPHTSLPIIPSSSLARCLITCPTSTPCPCQYKYYHYHHACLDLLATHNVLSLETFALLDCLLETDTHFLLFTARPHVCTGLELAHQKSHSSSPQMN